MQIYANEPRPLPHHRVAESGGAERSRAPIGARREVTPAGRLDSPSPCGGLGHTMPRPKPTPRRRGAPPAPTSPRPRARRRRPGQRALQEIRRYQSSTRLLLRPGPFARLVRTPHIPKLTLLHHKIPRHSNFPHGTFPAPPMDSQTPLGLHRSFQILIKSTLGPPNPSRTPQISPRTSSIVWYLPNHSGSPNPSQNTPDQSFWTLQPPPEPLNPLWDPSAPHKILPNTHWDPSNNPQDPLKSNPKSTLGPLKSNLEPSNLPLDTLRKIHWDPPTPCRSTKLPTGELVG
ncbi:hypothetical protein DV515_00015508 [Chloebia gouldiae]|uniref:Uncharacterized protein n=1 Tax=Chloebia gouldiae TaxID=44316 RepID=A0A3L8RWM8_CHLGU|nr:hypothetical protein DV515_00015508 [Chloebia gouldiae]